MVRSVGGFSSKLVSVPARSEGLVASARIYEKVRKHGGLKETPQAENWQKIAQQWFYVIGEYRFSCEWVGNMLSKAKLTVEKAATGDAPAAAVTAGPAWDALESLFGGRSNQGEMFRQLGLHFTVCGEGYIIGETADTDDLDDWVVAAATNTHRGTTDGSWVVGDRTFANATVIRLWKPDPFNPEKADAPSRAILPILAEIDGLTKHVAAQIDSRLASGGILLIPSEVTFGSAPTEQTETTGEGEEAVTETKEGQTSADEIVAKLIEIASTAIANRDSAAALVPIVMQIAGEHIANVKHLTFWSKLDSQSIALRKEAIRRLALGMDMPPEVLEGTADMNHWSSWQMEEEAIKAHTEPLLAVIISALTIGWLRPYLETVGGMTAEDAKLYSFGADTTGMRLSPNRSKEAIELYLMGILSLDATLRENGFKVTDKMGDAEKKALLLWKIASGSTTPELVAQALIQMKVPGISVPADTGAKTQEARPTPSLAEHPVRQLPDTQNNGGDRGDPVAAAASVMVNRALERAGNRLRTRMGGRKMAGVTAADTYLHIQVQSDEVDALLEDAWGMADAFAADYAIDPTEFRESLNAYTRDLLLTQVVLDRRALSKYLSLSRV